MQDSTPDYYKILGVPPTASIEEIRKAFLDLQKKYHPDVYKGADASQRTQEINEAWEWLRTPQRKAMYDAYRREQQGGAISKEEAEEFVNELVKKRKKELEDELERQRKKAQDEIDRQEKEAQKRVDEALEDAIRKARQERASAGGTTYTSSSSTSPRSTGAGTSSTGSSFTSKSSASSNSTQFGRASPESVKRFV